MTTKQRYLNYLNPQVILYQKQTTDETIFKEAFITKFENSAFAKKYYGKKIIVITKETHLARSLNHSKLFKNMTLFSKYLEGQNFKSQRDKILLYEDVPITKSQLKRVLSSCKGRIDFGDFFSFYEKQLFKVTKLCMREIKQISFIWSYINDIQFDSNTFASLKLLEKLDITAEASFGLPANQKYCISDDYEASNITCFMQNIVNLPRLKTLYLCFKDLLMEIDLVLNLLLLVVNSNIDDWHISIMMPMEEAKNIHILKPALAKINVFGIFTSDVSLKPDQIKAPSWPGNHRILSLYFYESQDSLEQNLRINLYPILKSCESLQALLIGFTRSQFVYKEEGDYNRIWAHNLKSVLLLAAFNYTVDGKDFSFMEEMLDKVQKESKTLINISVHPSRVCPVLKNKNWDTATLEGHNVVCNRIIGTKSLQSIQVSLQTTHFPYLNKLVTSSPNLIILELKLSHPNSQNYWDDDLPFSQFKNLKELTISFNSFSDQGQWGDNLTHQITTLENLEKLSIQTKGQWSMLLSKFCVFLNNAATLPNLKSLALETQIIAKLPKDPQFFIATNMMVVKLFQEIQKTIKYMIDVHRKIEYINICTFSITQLKLFFMKNLNSDIIILSRPLLMMISSNSQSFLNPRVILFQKQTKIDMLLGNPFHARLTDPSLGKKYYGKKILQINKKTDFIRALTLRKLFKRIELSCESIDGKAFISRGNKIIFYINVPITKSQIKRILLSFKGTFNFDDVYYCFDKQMFRMTRLYMRGVKQLSFGWDDESQISFKTKNFASLSRLEKLTVGIECSSDPYNLTRFVKNITNLSRLKFLNLDFRIQMDISLISDLLRLVEDSNIIDWQMKILISIKDVQEIAILESILAKITILKIFPVYDPNENSIKLPNQHENNRFLGIYFQEFEEPNQRVNLYSILKYCTSLKALSLGLTGYQALYEEENGTDLAEWAHYLQSFSIFSEPSSEDFLSIVLQKIQNTNKTLKNLEIFPEQKKLATPLPRHFWPTAAIERQNIICDKLVGTRFLESVGVSLQAAHFQYLDRLAAFSPNLAILQLKIFHPSCQNYWDDDLEFSRLKNLKELQISFSNYAKQGLWGDNIAHQILHLQNLEVLSIQTQDQWSMLLRKACIFVNNAATLPKLRSLVLTTQITPILQSKYRRALTDLDLKYVSHSYTSNDLLQEIEEKLEFLIKIRKIDYIDISAFLTLEIRGWKYSRYEK